MVERAALGIEASASRSFAPAHWPMKFLCPSCSTKYRVGDDKLVGHRRVRMKCRKCGTDLELAQTDRPGHLVVRIRSAANGPTSSGARSPDSSRAWQHGVSFSANSDPLSALNTNSDGSALADQEARRVPTRAKPSLRSSRPAPQTHSDNNERSRASSQATAEWYSLLNERTNPGSPHKERTNPGSLHKERTNPGSLHKERTNPGSAALSQQRMVMAAAAATPESEERSRVFPSRKGQVPSPASNDNARVLDIASIDGWFVGVHGSPCGPLTEPQLRDLLDSGSVSATSLVWREGLSDWQPLEDFSRLLALLEESQSFTQDTIVDPRELAKQPERRFSLPPIPSSPAELKPKRGVFGLAALLLVVSAAAGTAFTYLLLPLVKPGLPFQKRELSSATEPGKAAMDAPVVSERRELPEVKAAPVASPEAPAAESEAAATAEAPASPNLAVAKTIVGATQPALARSVEPQAVSSSLAPTTANQVERSKQLDSTTIMAVVSENTPGVMQACAAKLSPIPASKIGRAKELRVVVTLGIEPSGKVTRVATTRDQGISSELARCVAEQVKAWTFPEADGATPASIPFVFPLP